MKARASEHLGDLLVSEARTKGLQPLDHVGDILRKLIDRLREPDEGLCTFSPKTSLPLGDAGESPPGPWTSVEPLGARGSPASRGACSADVSSHRGVRGEHAGAEDRPVFDIEGATDLQLYVLNVSSTNDPPHISSVPETQAIQDRLYTYQVEAFDLDPGDVLSYTVTSGAAGMSIEALTGRLTLRLPE